MIVVKRGHLAIDQQRDRTTALSLEGDALLLVSSWERRCTEILQAECANFRWSGVIQFAEKGLSGRRDEHDKQLINHAFAASQYVAPLSSLPVSDFLGWRDQLVAFIVEAKRAMERPIDLVVDMSCLPKYYLLLTLGFSFSAAAVRSITFFYAEGRYSAVDVNGVRLDDHSFTQGEWSSYPVPYLEGELNAGRRVRIIASIGFETFKARKFIRAYEADRHMLITPRPGFTPEYEQRSIEETNALVNHLDLEPRDISHAPAGGVVEIATTTLDELDTSQSFSDVGLCLGTKPHSLGIGIAALLRPHLTVVCRIPSAYVETATDSLGNAWKYKITDLSAQPVTDR